MNGWFGVGYLLGAIRLTKLAFFDDLEKGNP
jgi:hypothetical protein